MKVGCEGCGASYSVADDKVAGRKLKMRCKKCGESIIIDAIQREAHAPFSDEDAAEVTPIGTALEQVEEVEVRPSWYIAGDEAAQGPFTLAEISAQVADGRVTNETLVFADGFSEWQQAADIPELRVSLVTIPPLPVRPAPATPPAELAPRPVSMGSDPFGDPERPVSGISPRVSGDELMQVGLQREGTVQFSLDSIRALSAVSSPSIAPAAPPKPGYASGDGSGLIDVRSLFESQAEENYKPITGMLASPLDTMAPLTLPQAGARPASAVDLRTKVFAGLAALGVVCVAVVAGLALTREPPPAAISAAAAEPPAPPATPASLPSAKPAAEPAPSEEAKVAEAKPVAPAAEPEAASTSEGKAAPGAISARRASAKSTAAPRQKAAAHEPVAAAAEVPTRSKPERSTVDIDDLLAGKSKSPEKAAAKPAPKGGSSSIDELLEGAVSGKSKPAPKSEPAAEPASGGLPETPSRDQMKAAYGKVTAKASQCKGPGMATAVITIAGSGKVSKVAVSGVEGPAKSCVESAVRATAFPKFQKDSFEVKFPFKLTG